MIRIVLVVVSFNIVLNIFGQTQPNPFDLQYRPQRPKTSSHQIPPKTAIDSSAFRTPVVKHPEQPQDHPKKMTIDTTSFLTGKDSSLYGETKNPFELKEGGGKQNPDSLAEESNKNSKEAVDKVIPLNHTNRMAKGIQIFFILLSLLFLIFVVNVERNFVKDLWRVISNENYSSLHLRNQRNTMRQILLIMGYSIFVFQAGIFLYNVLGVFGIQSRFLGSIWVCLALVLVIYLVRHSMITYMRWLFNNEKEMTLFGFDISIFNIMVGLVLLPINVVLNFGPESLYKPLIVIGVLVAAVAYLMRQFRWMLTARRLIANSLFLFFVYLCAIEILPLWAISKLFW